MKRSIRQNNELKEHLVIIHHSSFSLSLHHQDGSVSQFDASFSLLSPFICDAIATKEDRRTKRTGLSSAESAVSLSSSPVKTEDVSHRGILEQKNGAVVPSTITLKYVLIARVRRWVYVAVGWYLLGHPRDALGHPTARLA